MSYVVVIVEKVIPDDKAAHSSQHLLHLQHYYFLTRFKFSPQKGPPVARKTLQWESPELSQTPRAGPHR